MESRATTIAKNLALSMVFTAGVLGGSWLLSNSFLAVYWMWIVSVAFQVLLFALTLLLFVVMFISAVAAVNALVLMIKAIFRKNKKHDD